MNLQLKRQQHSHHAIDGALLVENPSLTGVLCKHICDTAEHNQTPLQQGSYNVCIHHCKQYRRKMPCILANEKLPPCKRCNILPYVGNNTKLPCYCPMLKMGNGVNGRTDGSIIIGERFANGAIEHSLLHFNRLVDRLYRAQKRGESITLNITDDIQPQLLSNTLTPHTRSNLPPPSPPPRPSSAIPLITNP